MKAILVRILFLSFACLPLRELHAKPEAEKPAAAVVRDGSSFEKAIVVKSVAAEYEWLRKKHPGYKLRLQALSNKDGKPYDVLSITTKKGEDIDVYFDISSFFGKGLK